ncbi:MAG: nucleotidyltransferase domain-containing protein [archaeon]
MIQKCSIWKVFCVFLENPTKKHHIREIGRKINLATTSVKKHVDSLIKEELILEKHDDIFKYYIGNFDNNNFRFYKKINNLLNLKKSGLIEYIEKTCSPDTIIMFGSYSKGEDIETSDIDLYVQSEKYDVELNKFEKKLNKQIQLFFYSSINDVAVNLRNNIINGTKVSGYMQIWN